MSQAENKILKIVRNFSATPEAVFDVFTKPEAMRVWWTDQTTFDIDLRVGGRWTIVRKEGDTTYTATGEYMEVERPHRLKYTYAMPQFSPNSDVISIEIESDGKGGSIMTYIHEGTDIAEELASVKAGAMSESEKGWRQGFDLMEVSFNDIKTK